MSRTHAPRKVAMILNTPGYGGVPMVAGALAVRLNRRLYTPFIYYLKNFPEACQSGHTQLRSLQASSVTLAGALKQNGKIGVITQLAGWLKDTEIDIIHTHSYRPNLYGRIAASLCRSRGLAIISHYHNQYDDKWHSDESALPLERHLASITDAMIAVSDTVRDHISERVGISSCRISVIENGVDFARFAKADRSPGRNKLGLTDDQFAIGLVGRVCQQKGTDVFVQAAIQLACKLQNARFLIIGNIEDRTMYHELLATIHAAGFSDVIRFTSHVDDTAPIFAALDIVVAPSRWEGFGLVLVEAMAAGVPIIASAAGAIPGITQQGRSARLIPAEDPIALARVIGELSENNEKRTALAVAGRERAQQFNWDRAVTDLSVLYEQSSGVRS